MIIKRAYKTELQPNNKQKTLLGKHIGTARYTYNWGMGRKDTVYWLNQLPIEHIKYPTAIDLHKELVILKKTDLAWMYEVSKCAPQEALRNLDKAYINFFEGKKKHPNYKKKKQGGSFRLNGAIKTTQNAIQLPRIGVIHLKEYGYIPTDAKILSATVSEKAGHWFVSVQVEEEINTPENNGGLVGIDLCAGNKMAHCSDGVIYDNPKAYKRFERKKKRIQREVSRKKLKSENWKKAVRKLGRLEHRVANVRKDAQHKFTTELAKTKSVIVIEDLNVAGIMKNNKVAKSIADVGMYETRRQLQYKTIWYGSQLIIADRYYPSSKTCSKCGNINHKLKLSDRIFNCPVCKFSIDRDLNASINLERVAISSMDTNINDCLRQEVSGTSVPVLADDSVNEYQRR